MNLACPPTPPPPRALPPRAGADLPPPVVMMGVPFDQVTTAHTVELIEEMIASGRPHLLATANVDFLCLAREDATLRRILLEADLVVCDGTPLLWLSKWLGDPLPERVAGSDLVPLLLALAARRGYRVFFLGGKDEVLADACRKVTERWPGLTIAGAYSPPFAPLDEMDHADICARIRAANADLLFVSFGCPKQEKWLALNYRRAGVPVSIGVGATIDFLAGSMKRAPVWMRKVGLEWVYRTLQEPKRLAKRYLKDMRVVGLGMAGQLWRMRGRRLFMRSAAAATGTAAAHTGHIPVVRMTLPERLDAVSARDPELWEEVDRGAAPWVVADGAETSFLDSTGTGRLVRLARNCRERGGDFILVAPSKAILDTLRLMRLHEFFTVTDTETEALRQVHDTRPEQTLEWPAEISAPVIAARDAQALSAIENIPLGGTLTIDLSAVKFLDSAGAGLMLRLDRRARQRGVTLVFANAPESVRSVLRLFEMDGHLLAQAAQ